MPLIRLARQRQSDDLVPPPHEVRRAALADCCTVPATLAAHQQVVHTLARRQEQDTAMHRTAPVHLERVGDWSLRCCYLPGRMIVGRGVGHLVSWAGCWHLRVAG